MTQREYLERIYLKTLSKKLKSSNTVAESALLTVNESMKMRVHWQLGEWQNLLTTCEAEWESNNQSSEVALMAAVACGQLGLNKLSRVWVNCALNAGLARDEAAKKLLSGALNSLAKAHLLQSDQPSEQSSALQLFTQSAQLALENQAVPGLIKARVQNEIEALEAEIHPQNVLSSRLMVALSNQKSEGASTAVLLPDISLYYAFNSDLGVWFREIEAGFDYSDGDTVEERLFKAVQSAEDVSLYSPDLLACQTDWSSSYHLSADRVNVLRPFAAKLADSTVLELGCGCGAITRYLGELGAQVVAVEGSARRSSIAAERCRDLDNVTVVCDKLQDIPFEGLFDVVTLIGVLEYSRVYVEALDPIATVLGCARRYLKPDGVLIVAIENQLGLKYFAGAPEDHGVGMMSGINDLYLQDSVVTFGLRELNSRIKKAGYAKVETFLPFPDYKMPMLMLHPLGVEDAGESFNLATLLRNSVPAERQPLQNPLFSLERAWPLIVRNGLVADLANSHVFVAHRHAETSVVQSNVLASYYSPKRSAAYSQQIEFCADVVDESIKVSVHRRNLAKTDLSFLPDGAKAETYIDGENHEDQLQTVVQREYWTLTQLVSWTQVWLVALNKHLLKEPPSELELNWIEYDSWLPGEFLDAIPRNLIINENEQSYFIDLEWQEKHALPLKLIVYRGLLVSFSTLTSVAVPEDNRLLDSQILVERLMAELDLQMTELDYVRFMPIIDSLTRRAHGLPPLAEPLTKPYGSRKIKVRDWSFKQTATTTSLTLYWKKNVSDQFNENYTIKRNYDLNSKVLAFDLTLPVSSEGFRSLRLDIAGREGCFFIRTLQIVDSQGELLWDWGFDTSKLLKVGQLEVAIMPGINQACLISTGNDPQFELDLPEDILPRLSEATVRLVFSAMDAQGVVAD